MNAIARTLRSTAVRRLPGASLLLAVLAVAIWLVPPAGLVLEYERTAIASGQVWRIVTCHFTHWSLNHLFWDTAALVVLGALCEADNRLRLLGCLAASAIVIPLAVWILFPDMQTYRGLSALDSAIFILLAVDIIAQCARRGEWRWVAGAGMVLAGFAAKIGYETVTGSTVFVDSVGANMVPIPLVHVLGAVVGMLAALVPPLRPAAAPCREAVG